MLLERFGTRPLSELLQPAIRYADEGVPVNEWLQRWYQTIHLEHASARSNYYIDDTLVNRREFDNALALNGGSTLANVLGRNIAIGIWRVTLTGSSGNQPCTNQINPQTSCHIDESTSTDSLNNVFKNLVVTSSPIGPNGSLTLSGNAVAQLDGEVDLVNTEFGECPGTTAPSDCIIRNGRRFTSAQIPAVPVQVGQQIQVTVTISFS